MKMKPFLMGAEVEYSTSSNPSPPGGRRPRLHRMLLNEIRDEHYWLPDIRSPGGIYIDNGSRYYLDAGNHNELASPELSTPRQIAVYDRAAEQILLRAKSSLEARLDGISVCITKHNINFSIPDQASWGQHEAYTCWLPLDSAADQLIPHLVSRVPYAGAGYLSATANGMGFELSQRARYMTRPRGVETTKNRAIFCTRAWKSSDVSTAGWTRTNLISKDSQRCSYGMYLTYGVTGLLFMIMNQGHKIGRDVQLKDPVAAMRSFSLDPWLQTKVRLANGSQATAIDIQRSYLREAQPHVESGRYPDWTHELMGHWSATLDQLERDPLQLGGRLDSYTKLKIFDHHVTRAALTWATLRKALEVLEKMRRSAPKEVVSAALSEEAGDLDKEQTAMCRQLSKDSELKAVGLDPLRFAARLQAVELNYHELGGWFDQLNPVMVTPDEVKQAIHNPPIGGRAEARSKSIEENHGQSWACDWEYVVNRDDETWFDLRDPFTNKRALTSSTGKLPRRRQRPPELDDLLARITD